MRNTIEHKITKKEVISHLEDILMRETDDNNCGSLHGIILSKIVQEFKEDSSIYDLMFGFDEHFQADYDGDNTPTSGRL